MFKKISMVLILLFFCGCGTTASLVKFQYEGPQNSDEVVIYIYRVKHIMGLAVSWPTHIDGKKVANLKQGAYFVIRTSTGRHSIEIGDRWLSLDSGKNQYSGKREGVFFAPGVYFIRVQGTEGQFLSKEEALPKISKMTYDSGM